MTHPPTQPKIYHITHVSNLASIASTGVVLSDASVIAQGQPMTAVGMSKIKKRRLNVLEVTCHPGDKVGDYVPLYFCPRSIMLFMIHRQNHPELTYHGGQGPMVHLEADLKQVIAWAVGCGRKWAFTTSNAGAHYAVFYSQIAHLNQVDWLAVQNTDFRSSTVKEGKQAEFLLHQAFPWELVSRIGVHSVAVRTQAYAAIGSAMHKPPVTIEPSWYY